MIDEIRDLPPEPELSAEEQQERDILAQPDAVEWMYRQAGGIGTIVWTAVESAALGRRVTSVLHYVELYDGDTLIGRQGAGSEKRVTGAGVAVPITELVIVGSRQRGE